MTTRESKKGRVTETTIDWSKSKTTSFCQPPNITSIPLYHYRFSTIFIFRHVCCSIRPPICSSIRPYFGHIY